MSLVKWLRKNNKKIMAVFVVFIMVSFLGVGQLLKLLSNTSGQKETIARFGHKQEISRMDMYNARQDLEMLQALKADMFLQRQDLLALLLGELLFSEGRARPEVTNYLTQLIQRNMYHISQKHLADMYKPRTIPAIYWILLCNEAKQAGVGIPTEEAGAILGQIATQLQRGGSYSQLIKQMMTRHSVSEQRIITTFGDLIAVLHYGRLVCNLQDTSLTQIKHMASWRNEAVEAEFVQLEAKTFVKIADSNLIPDNGQLNAHFNRYKTFQPGQLSADNPFGWGYKLPNRVQLDYLVVKLDEVLPTIDAPKQEELEDYYRRNVKTLFTEQVATDPNDPNSPMKDVIKSYAQVAVEVKNRVTTEKTISKAEMILQEARSLAQLPLSEVEAASLSAAEIGKEAVDYQEVARKLRKKHKVPILVGQTGLMSIGDIRADRSLSRLYVAGRSNNRIPLANLVFAVDPISTEDLQLLNAQKPRIFENIGPVRDNMTRPDTTNVAGQAMAVLRIVKAVAAVEPDNLDLVYDKTGVVFDPNTTDKDMFVVKEKVVDDVKSQQAYEGLRNKADELVAQAKTDGWTKAVNQFNTTYGDQAKDRPTDPNTFTISQRSLRRTPAGEMQLMNMLAESNPMILQYLARSNAENALSDQLYTLIPPDSNSLAEVPYIAPSQSDLSYYCIKALSVQRLSQQDFDKGKAQQIYGETNISAQSLSAIHFHPENILKRLGFQQESPDNEEAQQDADANSSKE